MDLETDLEEAMAEETDGEKGEEETEDAAEETKEGEGEEGGGEEGEGEEGEEGAAPAGGKGGKKKLIINVAGGVFLLVVLVGAPALYFLGFLDPYLGEEDKKTVASVMLDRPIIHEFPLLKADMKTGRCKSPLLKTKIMVQLGGSDLKRLQSLELRIMDQTTQYLRGLERHEMEGRQGAERLRSNITDIINALMAPSKIHTIMFKEFILQ